MRRFPWSATLVVPLVARHGIEGATHFSVVPVYLTALLFAAAEVSYQSGHLLEKPLTQRTWVMGAIMAYTVIVACIILALNADTIHQGSDLLGVQFAIGLFAGVIVRMLFVAGFVRTLRNESSPLIELSRLLSVGGYVLLFPAGVAGATYQIGLGLGLCLHAIVRGVERGTARRLRNRTALVQFFDAAKQLSEEEKTAAKLLVERKWTRLNKFLQEKGADLSTGLIIVRILQRRSEGDFDGASRLAESELLNAHFNRDLEALLRLLLALSLWDSGGEEGRVLEELERVRKIQPNCVPANTTEAVLRALKLPSSGYTLEHREEAELALKLVSEAARALRTASEWPWLVGQSVPVSVTYVQAALGLVQLKTGQGHLAKETLLSAIWRDPTYAPAYLYLGMYYFSEFTRSTHTERRLATAWLTRLCLKICIGLELHLNAPRRKAEELRRKLLDAETKKDAPVGANSVTP